MPLTSAYWPVPFASVVQSVVMVMLLASSLEMKADDRDSACAWNSSVRTAPLSSGPFAAIGERARAAARLCRIRVGGNSMVGVHAASAGPEFAHRSLEGRIAPNRVAPGDPPFLILHGADD